MTWLVRFFEGLEGVVQRRGRKLFLALYTITLGAIVTILGIVAMLWKPEVAPHVAAVITAFAGVCAVGASMFGIADAVISRAAIGAGLETVPGGAARRASGSSAALEDNAT